ncbi:MAG: glycosyltransferase family 2 protein [Litoreibacter sp.]|nr:glycosyltransferase family 2 protein [Litoreibacter sp.]
MNISARPPKISVIIPARNVAEFLIETLQSLSAQTMRDFEVVIIDDGSTDTTAQIAKAQVTEDPRFRLITGPGRGVSRARNTGLAQSKAPILLFLDADDLLAPDALARFCAALEDAPNPAALGGVVRIAEDGASLPSNSNLDLARGGSHLEKLLEKNFVVNGGALAIRRSAIEACGAYDPDLIYGEDWEFWCRLAELGDFAIVQGAPVLSYRQRASGANYRARGSVFATQVACLEKVAARRTLQSRFGRDLGKLLRSRRIDIFWSGVRSELQFGSRLRALMIAACGIALYPDSFARPDLALRFFRSLGRQRRTDGA